MDLFLKHLKPRKIKGECPMGLFKIDFENSDGGAYDSDPAEYCLTCGFSDKKNCRVPLGIGVEKYNEFYIGFVNSDYEKTRKNFWKFVDDKIEKRKN